MKVFHALVGIAAAMPITTAVSDASAHGVGAHAPFSAPAYGGVHVGVAAPAASARGADLSTGGVHGVVVAPPKHFWGTVAHPHFWGTVADPHVWGTPVPRVPPVGSAGHVWGTPVPRVPPVGQPPESGSDAVVRPDARIAD